MSSNYYLIFRYPVMIVYDDTCRNFIESSLNPSGRPIEDIVNERMASLHRGSGIAEYRSWASSLPALAKVLRDSEIIGDAEIGIEYTIKGGNRHRLDAIICGADENEKEMAVVIELKQWSTADRTRKPNYVHTVGGNGEDDYWHPSYQAANYVGIIENFYAYVQDSPVGMESCSYLHNMPSANFQILGDALLYPHTKISPVFLEGDEDRLGNFIKRFIKRPCKDLLYRIDQSTIRPSPKLSEMLYDAINGNDFFSYSDEQADAVSSIVEKARDSNKYGEKRTIIIKGRPGTGKSIVAINALGQLTAPRNGEEKLLSVYFTTNKAPRLLFSKKLVDNDLRKSFINELFKHPVALKDAPYESIACSIFDEAHRMFDWKGGIGMKKGEHLIEKCIKASKVSVFFLDEDQAVTVHDYLNEDRLRDIAERCGSRVIEGPTLTTQFRVLGGDGYLNFIRSILGYGDTCPPFDIEDYDVRIFDSACEMRESLREMNDRYGDSRMVAGYTYEWITKENYDSGYDIVLDGGDFKARWNMNKADYSWLYDACSFEDVGCIHTCQGLDMQYCGVIIGKDVRYEDGDIIYDQNANAKSDRSSGIRTCKDPVQAIRLIRNTYNVLLTRGMRGTFIYCEDEGLREYFKTALSRLCV